MKNVTITMYISLIMESVKGETLLKGRVDLTTDDKSAALAYSEEAGDEEFHERKLLRTLYSSVSRLVSKIGDYVVSHEIDETEDTVKITLSLSDQFNDSMGDALARLCSKYIEDHMLYLWWGTFNQKQANFYLGLLELDLTDIQGCFSRRSPSIPETGYTKYIKTQLGNSYQVQKGASFTLTYEISYNSVDDVEAYTSNAGVVYPCGKRGQSFLLYGNNEGVAYVKLYSKHDEDVYHNVKITVK